MSSRTSNTVQRCSGISDECNAAALLRTTHRNHRGASRSNKWTDNETLRRVLGESIRDVMRSLRERSVRGLQKRSYGYFEKRNRPDQ